VRRTLVQQDRGFCGPNNLGRCHPLPAASTVFLLVNTPTETKGVGARQASDLRLIEWLFTD